MRESFFMEKFFLVQQIFFCALVSFFPWNIDEDNHPIKLQIALSFSVPFSRFRFFFFPFDFIWLTFIICLRLEICRTEFHLQISFILIDFSVDSWNSILSKLKHGKDVFLELEIQGWWYFMIPSSNEVQSGVAVLICLHNFGVMSI